jgi:Protein of unknown function (DUF3431)
MNIRWDFYVVNIDKMFSNIEVVVARYKEDLSWLKPVKHLCTVYNKNVDVIPFDCFFLENILGGNEADTYMKHILLNYPNFPEYTIFTQGNIADHVNSVEDFIQTITDIEKGKIMDDYIGLNQRRGKDGWCDIRNFNDSHHSSLPLKEWWYKIYDSDPPDNTIRCNFCAIFLVSKKNLLFHSKGFYQELYDLLSSDFNNGGYILERFWTTIFDGARNGIFDREAFKNSTFEELQESQQQELQQEQ